MDKLTDHVAIAKEFIQKVYDEVTAKVPPRNVLLPLSGICFVYCFFIRKTEGRKQQVIKKEPCLPDEPYTGHEEPPIIIVR